MMPAEAKDVPATVSSAAEPKFDLNRDIPLRRRYAETAAEAARLRAIFDRLAVLRNAPEPNPDEEAELSDLEIGSLDPELSKPIPPVEEKVLSPAEPGDYVEELYCIDTGRIISILVIDTQSIPYGEEWLDEIQRDDEAQLASQSCQLVTKDKLCVQSRVKSLKYNIPRSTLAYAADINDLLVFLRSEKIIDDFIVDNNTILIDPFHDSEEDNPQDSSELVTKDDKNDELSLQSGVKSTRYNIPSSSLPHVADLSNLLAFLRSKKVIHDVIVDNNTISIETLNNHQQKSIGKIPESLPISPGKPGISESLKETVTITYPKQGMESQPSTSGFQKDHTDAETTKLPVVQVTNSPTDSPQLIEQLELRYPHKIYRYLAYLGMSVNIYKNVRTKEYCKTCDPRYRRNRKTWLLHAKNRHYEGVIKNLYF